MLSLAPALTAHPSVYADLLREYIHKHKVDCWLVNSGWTGGKYGEGRRMPIKATRTLLTAALNGSLKDAVVDWPNTEGYNMFLYPLARMTGGVYLEHAHRLLGSLVGFTTLMLAVHVQITERRGALKALAWTALGFVVVQGILGGLRVTGHFTLSTRPADTDPKVVLAAIHGVFGQVKQAISEAQHFYGEGKI